MGPSPYLSRQKERRRSAEGQGDEARRLRGLHPQQDVALALLARRRQRVAHVGGFRDRLAPPLQDPVPRLEAVVGPRRRGAGAPPPPPHRPPSRRPPPRRLRVRAAPREGARRSRASPARCPPSPAG